MMVVGVMIFLASMATTMHWEPKVLAAVWMSSGVLMAAVLMETLSAPAFRQALMVSMSLMPPPTVKGMNSSWAQRLIRSIKMPRLSELAVMSRKTSSSAPWVSYCLASSMGSPASFRSTKWVPLTTLPSLTSRQGIMRLASIIE